MGKLSPRIPREHNKYHGYTVRGTANCPLTLRISGTPPGLPVQAGVGGNKCDEWDLEYLSLHLSHRCVK